MSIEETVSIWIKSIMRNKGFPLEIIDPQFHIEDGMTFNEYWDYEASEFARLSELFNLDENFNVKITNQIKLTEDKSIYFLWIINSLGKLAFKFHLTLNKKYQISSNEFRSQQVLKCTIENNRIKNVKMMIRGKHLVSNIITSQLQLEGIFKTETTEIDGFYLSQFTGDNIEDLIGKEVIFHLLYEDGIKTKVRMVLEDFNLEHKPFKIEDGYFIVNGHTYPVNLVIYCKDKSVKVIESPRELKIQIAEINNIIMTDVLDNDWVYSF